MPRNTLDTPPKRYPTRRSLPQDIKFLIFFCVTRFSSLPILHSFRVVLFFFLEVFSLVVIYWRYAAGAFGYVISMVSGYLCLRMDFFYLLFEFLVLIFFVSLSFIFIFFDYFGIQNSRSLAARIGVFPFFKFLMPSCLLLFSLFKAAHSQYIRMCSLHRL